MPRLSTELGLGKGMLVLATTAAVSDLRKNEQLS